MMLLSCTMKTLLRKTAENTKCIRKSRNQSRCTCHGNQQVSKRSVSTRTPLQISFNSVPERKFDIWSKNVGLFCVPELKDPDGFKKVQRAAVSEAWSLLKQAVEAKPGEETVRLFDDLSDNLCKVADLADFVQYAHPDESFVQAANEAHMAIGTLVEELNTHTDLYNAMHTVVNDHNIMNSFDEETRRVAELFLFDFEISGIHLDAEKRAQAVKLHEEILTLQGAVLHGASAPVAVPKNLLPADLQSLFSLPQNSDVIQLAGMYAEHPDERIREAAYRLYLSPNPQLEAVLKRLLQARHELSHLVGYKSYAERALKSTMARDPENVTKFLNSLSNKLEGLANEEFEEMRLMKKQIGGTRPLMPWDAHYLVMKIKEQRANINSGAYNDFFSLGDCMDGLNMIFQSLYGVTLTAVEVRKGEVWSPDIIKLAVHHESEGLIGFIYCDFFQRPGKPQQDCHFTIRGGRRLRDGSYQLPVVVLQLHLPPPTVTTPTLLSSNSVNNLFHEAGHAMHSMLARTRYQHVTGTRCATDFAEVPSILMEYYANDERVLPKFAKHYKTREVLPPDMIEKLQKAKSICCASDTQLQVFYSMLDQAYHAPHPLPSSLGEVCAKLHGQLYGLAPVPETAWHLRFSHLASYGAKYYSYLMSRAVASRLWTNCFQSDPLNRMMGGRYREKMLRYGGAREPILMYEDMLEETFDLDNLADTLVSSIKWC